MHKTKEKGSLSWPKGNLYAGFPLKLWTARSVNQKRGAHVHASQPMVHFEIVQIPEERKICECKTSKCHSERQVSPTLKTLFTLFPPALPIKPDFSPSSRSPPAILSPFVLFVFSPSRFPSVAPRAGCPRSQTPPVQAAHLEKVVPGCPSCLPNNCRNCPTVLLSACFVVLFVLFVSRKRPKNSLQSLENCRKIFPIVGKNGRNFPAIGNIFANHWKTCGLPRAQ